MVNDEAFVFVSYASEDKNRVKKLVDLLHEHGIPLFWDDDIEYGQSWRRMIHEHIDAAVCTLVIWSKASAQKLTVQGEAERSLNMLPVLLDEEADIPFDFSGRHYCDLSDWDGEEHPNLRRLLTQLDSLIARGPRPVQQWKLENTDWQVSRTREIAETLRETTVEIGTLAQLASADIEAREALNVALREVDKTYRTVSEAVTDFMKAGAAQPLEAEQFIEIERESYSRKIEKGRGHCGLIALHYAKYKGLRDWLTERADEQTVARADELFQRFSDADGGAFEPMVEIADVLKHEARAIVTFLMTGQVDRAAEKVAEARQALLPLEDELGAAMRELQGIRDTVGFVGDVDE